MIYVCTNTDFSVSGCISDGDASLSRTISFHGQNVVSIQADGEELERCCEILGRPMPPCRVYTFLGVNAQEIATNWSRYRGR